MTIMEAIGQLDGLKHNDYSQDEKVAWLSRLDHMVKKLVIDTHEGAQGVTFSGYDADTPLDTALLVSAPFEEMYLRWMEAQIDYHNRELDRYNASITMFNVAFEAYKNHYNRTHMPKGVRFKYF